MLRKLSLRLGLSALFLGIVPALALSAGGIPGSTAHAQTIASYTFVCGTVTGYTAPTATVAGSVTVGGFQIPIAAGTATFTAVPGSAALSAGNDLCLRATLDATGAITTATIDIGKGATLVSACGVITAYSAPTATVAGTFTINNLAVPLREGSALTGTAAASLASGQNVCVNVSASAGGVASAVSFTTNSVPLGASYTTVCGTVTGYTAPTATVAGSVTVGGFQIPIAAGTAPFTAVPGSAALSAGNDLCLHATFDATGAISSATIDIGKGATLVTACGVIGSFTAATATVPGIFTINNLPVPLGVGSALTGTAAASLANGQNVCVNVSSSAGGVASAVSFTSNSVPLAAYAVFVHAKMAEIAS